MEYNYKQVTSSCMMVFEIIHFKVIRDVTSDLIHTDLSINFCEHTLCMDVYSPFYVGPIIITEYCNLKFSRVLCALLIPNTTIVKVDRYLFILLSPPTIKRRKNPKH